MKRETRANRHSKCKQTLPVQIDSVWASQDVQDTREGYGGVQAPYCTERLRRQAYQNIAT